MARKPQIIGIIPARYASTRLPAKLLIDFCGKPMIQHVYERVRQAALIERVIVATDHQKISEAVGKFGGEVMMTPSNIRSGSDRAAYVAQHLTDADIIVNVQGDEPLIAPQMIDEAIEPLIRDSNILAGTLVKRITASGDLLNPDTVKAVLDADQFAVYFSRSPIPYLRDGTEMASWHLHYPYYKHIGVYVFRKGFLMQFASWPESALEQIEKLEQLRIIEHGYKIKATVTVFDSTPVDIPADIEKVRKLMQAQTAVNLS